MAAVAKSYKPGEVLFTEGQSSNSLFIIKKGTLSVRKMKGKEFIEVAKVQTGEVLGDISFFDRKPRSATVTALTDVDLLEISFESMEKIYNSIPDYMKTIVTAMADRLRRANEQIRHLQK